MREKKLSTLFVTVLIGFLLTILFATPVPAIEKWRESALNGGWQIWIEAADYDSRERTEDAKTLTEAGLFEEWKKWYDENDPFLSEDILISMTASGVAVYNFVSPAAGDAHVYGRAQSAYVMQNAGIQTNSWWLLLNVETFLEDNSQVIDSPGVWTWKSGRLGSLAPTQLVAGDNVMRARIRESSERQENLLDVILVSTVELGPMEDETTLQRGPIDEMFKAATPTGPASAVQAGGKLATMWGTIKVSF